MTEMLKPEDLESTLDFLETASDEEVLQSLLDANIEDFLTKEDDDWTEA